MTLVKLGVHYAVMAQIDGTIRPLIVDTGAGATSLNLDAVDKLKLQRDPGNAKHVLGIGQTKAQSYANAIPSILAFGDLVYRDRSTAVAKTNFGTIPERDSAGILGDDILSQFEVEFDFPAKKLTFYRASECYGSFAPWIGSYSAIPFVHDDAKIVIEMVLNGERSPAIVDTGNNVSLMSRNFLAHWKVSRSALSKPVGKIGSPLNDGTSFSIRMFPFDKVGIGHDIFPGMKIGVVDIEFPLAPVNLGLDFWRSRKIWISYPSKRMFISRKGPLEMAYPVLPSEAKDAAIDVPAPHKSAR